MALLLFTDIKTILFDFFILFFGLRHTRRLLQSELFKFVCLRYFNIKIFTEIFVPNPLDPIVVAYATKSSRTIHLSITCQLNKPFLC